MSLGSQGQAIGGGRNGGTSTAMGGMGGGEGGLGVMGKRGVQTEEYLGSVSNDATAYADTNVQVASMESVTAHIN
jgi:hypothetical protein